MNSFTSVVCTENRWRNQIMKLSRIYNYYIFSLFPSPPYNHKIASSRFSTAFDLCCSIKHTRWLWFRVMKWVFNSPHGNLLATLKLSSRQRPKTAKYSHWNLNPSDVIWILIRITSIIGFQFVDSSIIPQIAQHSSVFVFLSFESLLFQQNRIKFPTYATTSEKAARKMKSGLRVIPFLSSFGRRKKKLNLHTLKVQKNSAKPCSTFFLFFFGNENFLFDNFPARSENFFHIVRCFKWTAMLLMHEWNVFFFCLSFAISSIGTKLNGFEWQGFLEDESVGASKSDIGYRK